MSKTIRYDLRSAYESGVTMHPRADVERLGLKVVEFEAVEIWDCVLMKVEGNEVDLPGYMEYVEVKE